MDFDLYSLIVNKENSQIEAKCCQYALPNSIWETYSAFANTNGGVIILGASEDKITHELSITGIDQPEKVKKEFWDNINNPRKVSNNLLLDSDFNEFKLDDGKTIFIIHVPKARLELRPVHINDDMINGSYKRNHEGDYHLTRAEISTMLRDASPVSYDMKVYDNIPLSVLCDETIAKYRRYHEAYKPNHPWLGIAKEHYLMMIGAAAYSDSDNLLHPTMAGLLMFSEEHVITRVLPDFFLDYQENLDPGKVRWTDRIQSISGEWSGNLFDFFLLVNNKLVLDLKVPFKLNGMQRIDNTLLHEAIREAFINCLSNADYFGRCGVIIRKNTDSIVFENPGSIRVGKEQMLQGGISDARNKTIMKMFNLLGYGEKAGSGIPLIIKSAKELNLPMPLIEENTELDRTSLSIIIKPIDDKKTYLEVESSESGAKIQERGAKTLKKGAETSEKGAETSESGAEYSVSLKAVENKQLTKKERNKQLIYEIINTEGESSARALSEKLQLSLRRTQELIAEMLKEGKIYFRVQNMIKYYTVTKI